ncbi:MAG: NADH-quinone oxidoreductase subunit NuoH [Vicinamibacterales bacterium]
MIDTVVVSVTKIVVLLLVLLLSIAYLVLLERKVMAWVQVRLGPMRVGTHGLLQPIADVLKLLVKEDITPSKANRWVFTLAPVMAVVPALLVFAVIPLGGETTLFGRSFTWYVADVNVALLYIVSVSSIGLYGLILGGWASNSKYPMISSLRVSAQLVSYEVAVTMTLVSLILMSGTLSMVGIVKAQLAAGVWYVFLQPLAFGIYFIGGLAETNRAPFDLPEAESELTGGFHTEYSGIRFALFFLAEYANMIVVSSVATTLFLGGWLRPFPNIAWLSVLDIVPGLVWFIAKTFLFLFVFLWVRATLPRYRYDQLMRLGWKVLIPLAIANVMLTATLKVLL